MPIRHVAIVIGTRPEAIKMAPVHRALTAEPGVRVSLVATAQHREMLDQVLEVFGLTPDVDLGLMRPGQELGELTARVVTGVDAALGDLRPDAVLVHGDTTTTLAGALAAFYRRLPVGHVEAGLRTGDLGAPWPEEMNRRLVDPLCRWCFAPTPRAAGNLLREGVPGDRVHVTGNTAVDAIEHAIARVRESPPAIPGFPEERLAGRRLVLVTGHRRESFGRPLGELCVGMRRIVAEHPDTVLVYPVHLNPNVRGPVHEALGGAERIHLIDPVPYLPFVRLMDLAALIVTDSGGIQEEAPSLGRPVLVTRQATERPEALECGAARLVGTDAGRLVEEAREALAGGWAPPPANPFGDGRAAGRIARILLD